MNIPLETSPIWKAIILGEITPQFNFLAIKIFLGRVKMSLAIDSSEENINKLASELRELFIKNRAIPTLQKDLELIQ